MLFKLSDNQKVKLYKLSINCYLNYYYADTICPIPKFRRIFCNKRKAVKILKLNIDKDLAQIIVFRFLMSP